MTISSESRKAGPFTGNGVTTSFPFTFKVFEDSDLRVVRTTPTGAETGLVLDSDYSVTLNSDQNATPGGTITYPLSGDPLPTSWMLTAVGNIQALQETDLTNQGGFYPQVIEDALDRATILIQQAEEQAGRTLRLPVSDDGEGIELPGAAARAGKVLGFDDSGVPQLVEVVEGSEVAIVNRQKFTATAAQTDFTTSFSFTPGVNAVSVFLNGSKLVITDDYLELTDNTIRLNTGATVSDTVEVVSVGLAAGNLDAIEVLAQAAQDAADRVDLGALDQAVEDSEAARDVALVQADRAESEADRAESEADAAAADRVQTGLDAAATDADRIAAESARDAALLSRGVFASTADALSKGVASLASVVAGSGGTDGTFDLAFSGGAGTGAAGRFVVAGGAVVSTVVTATGRGYTSAPTVSFAASSGLTGASATAVIANNTDSGEYFSVPQAAPSSTFLDLYLNNSGVASFVNSYPSTENFLPAAPVGFAWSVVDSSEQAAIGVKDDGTFVAQEIESPLASIDVVNIEDGRISADRYPGYSQTFADADGNVAAGIRDDGTFETKDQVVENLTVGNINGQPASTVGGIDRFGGKYTYQINFINNTGQSLGEGSTPATAITTTQEYDNVGFPAQSTSPTTLVALTVANTQVGSRGESPMYGTLGSIKELIRNENNLAHTANDYQLAACNNAYSGFSITQLNKGTAPYTAAMTQVQAAYDIAVATDKSMGFQSVTWTQGEADTGMSTATYKGHLKQLALDYNTDGKAITGQKSNIAFITYQCATANRNIAIAQLEAANESPLIHMACPMYQFDYGDSQHINAASSKWLGGYYGLVYKRVVVDGLEWQPLQPVGHAIIGSTIDMIFNKTGLVLDTTLIPAQTDSGFEVRDAGNSLVTISAITVVAPNRVRLTVASTPAAGWSVRYGYNSATGKSPFVGGCGNLRDSQGDFLTYEAVSKPLHNWCVIFNYTI